jgi:hypothetical protein
VCSTKQLLRYEQNLILQCKKKKKKNINEEKTIIWRREDDIKRENYESHQKQKECCRIFHIELKAVHQNTSV